jgi:hypothetical protein
MVAGRELAANPVEFASRAVGPARLAAALAMAPLAEHETEDEPEEENGGSSGDGETFESENYDYTVTFDDSVWQVVNESEEEDEAGNPFEVLQLGSEVAVVTFYGLTADFNDAEDCVESLEDFVAGVDGIDDVEERDDIEGALKHSKCGGRCLCRMKYSINSTQIEKQTVKYLWQTLVTLLQGL